MSIKREDLDAGKIDLADVIDPDGEPLPPVTPGEILANWIADRTMNASGLARALHVPVNRITTILKGQRSITAETALRLGRFFGTGPVFWLNLQTQYDLQMARDMHGRRIESEIEQQPT